MPGEREGNGAGHRLNRDDTLEKVAFRRRQTVREREDTAAAVAGKHHARVRLGALALRGEDIEEAVVVGVAERGEVVERRAEHYALPQSAGRAGIAVPPSAGDDVAAAIAVEVGGVDEDGAPRLHLIDQVAAPLVERQLRGGGPRIAVIDKHVDARGVVVVGFVEDVEVAVAIEVGQSAFMDADSARHDGLGEVALAVAVEDPRGRMRVVGAGRAVNPLPHLAAVDVEVAVAVHVGDLEGVAVNHVVVEQVAWYPFVVAVLIPAQTADAVADHEHHLGPAAGNELPGRGAREGHGGVDDVFAEGVARDMFEPAPAADDVDLAVAIHVEGGDPFHFARGPGVDFVRRPRLFLFRVGGDGREEQLAGALVPEDKLGAAIAGEIGDGLVVVFAPATVLDDPALPCHVRAELGIGVFPPPDFVGTGIAAEDKVEVAVAVDVVGDAARFDAQLSVVDRVALPAGGHAAEPDDGRATSAFGEDDVGGAVVIEVGGKRGGLLPDVERPRQIAPTAGEPRESRLGGQERRCEKEQRRDPHTPDYISTGMVSAPYLYAEYKWSFDDWRAFRCRMNPLARVLWAAPPPAAARLACLFAWASDR